MPGTPQAPEQGHRTMRLEITSLTGNIIYFMLLVVSVHFAGVAASAGARKPRAIT